MQLGKQTGSIGLNLNRLERHGGAPARSLELAFGVTKPSNCKTLRAALPESRRAIRRGMATLLRLRVGPKREAGVGEKSVGWQGAGKPRTDFASKTLDGEIFWQMIFRKRMAFRKRMGINGTFHLLCCRETLAVIAARHHGCGVRPTIPSGEPPPRAPAAAGHFSARLIGRAWKGLRVPIVTPTFKACPYAQQSGPPSRWFFEMSVRLFMARTLARRSFHLSNRLLAIGVENNQHQNG
jgi:hypothetical protein